MCKILKNIQGKTAEDLLDIYGIKNEIPINIDKLLSKMGIDLLSADFAEIEEKIGYERGDILGATLISGEEVSIFYRKGSTSNRRRFTIAHELAHCCLHTDKLKETNIQLRKDSDKKNHMEMEANIFAGELLIPKDFLLTYYHKMYVPSLKALAEIFNVSTRVMKARLEWLELPYYKDVAINEG